MPYTSQSQIKRRLLSVAIKPSDRQTRSCSPAPPVSSAPPSRPLCPAPHSSGPDCLPQPFPPSHMLSKSAAAAPEFINYFTRAIPTVVTTSPRTPRKPGPILTGGSHLCPLSHSRKRPPPSWSSLPSSGLGSLCFIFSQTKHSCPRTVRQHVSALEALGRLQGLQRVGVTEHPGILEENI